MPHDDDAYVLDMAVHARKVVTFIHGFDFDRFAADERTVFAVTRAVQVIGEAARKVSTAYRDAHPEVPWMAITTMRHRLVHEYAKVDVLKVWRVAEQHVPELLRLLAPLVPQEPPPGPDEGGR